MRKVISIFTVFLIALTLAGCRRTDVRTFTLTLPDLKEADKVTIRGALSKYGGIDKDSYVWDLEKKTLTLKYDSMQIAKTNIRMAIEEKGVAVDWNK
jgi:hypothetical protein